MLKPLKFKKPKLNYSLENVNPLTQEERIEILNHSNRGWKSMVRILGAALAMNLVVTTWGGSILYGIVHSIRDTQTTNTDILTGVHELLDFVAKTTSDEASAARSAGTQAIILQINCDNRQATQALVDGLIENGVLKPNTVSVISPECEVP